MRSGSTVLDSSYSMSDHQRLLQILIERARKNSRSDVVTGHDVDLRVQVSSNDPKVTSTEQRDESRIGSVTVDPSGEGIIPTRRHDTRSQQRERHITFSPDENPLGKTLCERV